MTKPKTVKPKRQWEMWAVVLDDDSNMNGNYFDTKEKAEYSKDLSAISFCLKIKKVLVTEL